MFRYADPSACPACRLPLPPLAAARSTRCPACALALDHPLTVELSSTLRQADRLVAGIRAATPLPVPVPAFAAAATTRASSSATARAEQEFWEPTAPSSRSHGTSVPTLLLSLGGLCLGVAAMIFLAVAWAWMGVGGRTATLVLLTVGAALSAVVLDRRGLRSAPEALTAVGALLAMLDVVGGVSAGWLDALDAGGVGSVIAVVGAVVAGYGLATMAAAPRVVAAELATGVGLILVAQGLLVGSGPSATTTSVPGAELIAGVTTVVLGLLAVGAHLVARRALAVTLAVGFTMSWLELVAFSLQQIDGVLTAARVWSGGGWGLLLASAAVLLPLAVPVGRGGRVPSVLLGAAAGLATVVVGLPVLDNGVTAVALASAGAALAWSLLRVAPVPHAAACAAPAAVAVVPALGVELGLLGQAVVRALQPDAALRLAGPDPITRPWLVLPLALVLAVVTLAVSGPRLSLRPGGAEPAVGSAAAVAAVAGAATLALYDVPLWSVVLVLALAGTTVAGLVWRRDDPLGLAGVLSAAALWVADLVVARPSEPLLLAVALGLTAGCVLALLPRTRLRCDGGEALAGVLLPTALGLATAVGGLLLAPRLSVEASWVAVAVVVLTALAGVVVPRVEVEVTTAGVWLVAGAAAVPSAPQPAVLVAVLLTLAGALTTVTTLVHRDRRVLAPVATALLLAATWVRLADVGVTAPEAYTLPTAVVLTAFGLLHLRRDRTASTTFALSSGLLLATAPSLLWAIGIDVVSLRALLLGAGCLILVLGGARLRWQAPVLVGAGVGALLVLAELAPYAAQVPQWVFLALAGSALLTVGITWEARMQQVRSAGDYLRRLR